MTAEEAADVASVVRGVWAKAVGIDESELPEDTPIGNFTDSITLMRVRADIKRAVGVAPSMVEILGAQNITALVRLAEVKNPAAALSAPPSREGYMFMYGYVVKAADKDKQALRRAIEASLLHHRVLASFLVSDPAMLDGDTFGTLDEFREVTREAADIVRWLVDDRNSDKPVGGAMRS
ncbi:hypothetical protein KVR01_011873 [Diaporthe batatas]|uniref:uncharacterized protein n=1 Tax=Diaporthe batatas TaxID=748121 RepID=UPI001D059768|nr:uncharacterized protein KVR01_011873 [Diaporthe batatas]KAG8158112.1 hypothetical protein KVR01_011873 [Diaporthe batatas]